jgi:hypothetical protein
MTRIYDAWRRGEISEESYEILEARYGPNATIEKVKMPVPPKKPEVVKAMKHSALDGLKEPDHPQYVINNHYDDSYVCLEIETPGTDNRIPTERAIRTELDRLLGQSGIVSTIRQYNEASDAKVPSVKAIRSELDAIIARLLALEVKA